ncbi:MAG: DNA-3-methyladenine glycosylase I, partial [Firmicutes bacterium]|nr:DNA-3-methyladenine glycosylase I [Bacillota bacterium]
AAFDGFNINKVIAYGEAKIEELMNNPGIIRNRRKIKAAILNSVIFKGIQAEFGSFDKYIWSFTGGNVVFEDFTVRTTSPLSDEISKDLKKRGMTFVGSTIIYSYLQAIGVINGHSEDCFCYANSNFHSYGTVNSTNIIAKEYAGEGATHGTVVIADSQTAGRGRLGRSFVSPDGSGLYMSIVLRPFVNAASCTSCASCADDIAALYPEAAKKEMRFNPSLVTVAAGVAVIRALKTICDIDAEIKWVNDILFGGKKLCGILAEGMMNTCSGSLDAIILGIGINLKSPENGYPEEIRSIVTNIEEVSGKISLPTLRNQLAFEITSNVLALLSSEVSDEELISEYRAYCSTIGQDIFVYKKGLDGDATPAKAIDIDKDGGLIVQYESTDPDIPGSIETLTFGEISIRPGARMQK